MKKILVACGTGGVTSKNIAMKIEKFLKENKIDAKVDTCKVIEVTSKVSILHPDLVLSATQLPKIDCPSISTTALLTGIGIDKIYAQVLEILK